MKINFLFVAIFLMGIFSTSATTSSLRERNCSHEASVAYDVVFVFSGGDKQAAWAQANYVYNECIEAGGSPGGVVDVIDDGA